MADELEITPEKLATFRRCAFARRVFVSYACLWAKNPMDGEGKWHVEKPYTGEPFDPERHDAVEVRMTTDAPENTVVDVIRAGYAVDGRVLRPAQVAVARRPQTSG